MLQMDIQIPIIPDLLWRGWGGGLQTLCLPSKKGKWRWLGRGGGGESRDVTNKCKLMQIYGLCLVDLMASGQLLETWVEVANMALYPRHPKLPLTIEKLEHV